MYDLFFFNDTATTEIYTLSLHDALPIWSVLVVSSHGARVEARLRFWNHWLDRAHVEARLRSWNYGVAPEAVSGLDRKSTRLNSSHANISYAVFCLKKKKNLNYIPSPNYS